MALNERSEAKLKSIDDKLAQKSNIVLEKARKRQEEAKHKLEQSFERVK